MLDGNIPSSIECLDRRVGKREKGGWHHNKTWTHGWGREFHGHHLVIYKPSASGGGEWWYKWIDGHFRGHTEKLAVAKGQLESEALGDGLAWGIK